MPSWLNLNNALRVIAGAVAVAGAIVALPVAGIALPAVLVGVATKVVVLGATAGIVAAKILPGHGVNAPAPAGTVPIVVDTPIPPAKLKPGAA